MAKFFRFVCIVLLGWSGVSPALAQQGGERRGVSLTPPGRQAASPTRVMERRAEQRRQMVFRWTSGANPAVAANEADSLALVALYDAAGGAAWRNRTNWLTGPVADWYGVTLNDAGRVEAVDPERRGRLLAEMRLPGRAWLEFEIRERPGGSVIRQTAIFEPVGLSGLAYWYLIYPLHMLVFRGMLQGIAAVAEAAQTSVGAAS